MNDEHGGVFRGYIPVHVTPLPDEPEHRLDGWCWCQPLLEEVPPNGRIYIHRRTIDSPHIEVEA